MSEILLKADEARSTAKLVTKSASDSQAEFDSLKTTLGGLADSFRGQSATAFQDKYEEWSTSAKDLIEALDSLGEFLNAAADTIEQTDQEIANKIR